MYRIPQNWWEMFEVLFKCNFLLYIFVFWFLGEWVKCKTIKGIVSPIMTFFLLKNTIYIPFFIRENIWESGDFSKSLHLFSYELFSYLREITDLLKRPHLWFFFPLGESKITKELFKGERNHWCSLTASFIQCV